MNIFSVGLLFIACFVFSGLCAKSTSGGGGGRRHALFDVDGETGSGEIDDDKQAFIPVIDEEEKDIGETSTRLQKDDQTTQTTSVEAPAGLIIWTIVIPVVICILLILIVVVLITVIRLKRKKANLKQDESISYNQPTYGDISHRINMNNKQYPEDVEFQPNNKLPVQDEFRY